MLYEKRGKFGRQGRIIGKVFAKTGISPNQWTILCIIAAFVSFYFIVAGNLLVGAIFFAASSFFDVVDGAVARHKNQATKFGAYLDTISDRYAEFIVIAGLLFVALPPFIMPAVFWLFLYLFGSNMTTYSKAAAKEKDLVKKEVKGGILERGDRIILLFIGLLLGTINMVYLTYILVILAILSNITAFQRMLIAAR